MIDLFGFRARRERETILEALSQWKAEARFLDEKVSELDAQREQDGYRAELMKDQAELKFLRAKVSELEAQLAQLRASSSPPLVLST